MSKIAIFDNDADIYIFECPHCNLSIQVERSQVNCRIFRHGVYKKNYEQVNPHLPKKECDSLVENKKVYGCCKPFEIITKDNKLFVTECDYK